MNNVTLIGNLTRDPELRTTATGVKNCAFSIAVQRKKNKDGVREADFINIVCWNGTAENCAKYLTKGKKVAINGEIRTRNYEKDGKKVYVTEVVANIVEFISPFTNGNAEPAQNEVHDFMPDDNEELPFI